MIKNVQHILRRSLSIWGWQRQMRKPESWHYLLYLIVFVLELLSRKCVLLLQFAVCCFTPVLHTAQQVSWHAPWLEVPRGCPVLPSATLPDSLPLTRQASAPVSFLSLLSLLQLYFSYNQPLPSQSLPAATPLLGCAEVALLPLRYVFELCCCLSLGVNSSKADCVNEL